MSGRKANPACAWLIEQRPDILRRLEEVSEGVFVLGNSNRLVANDVRVCAPHGVRLYRLNPSMFSAPDKSEILFVAPNRDVLAFAYAVDVSGMSGPRVREGEIVDIAKYRWADNDDTSEILKRVYANRVNILQAAWSKQGYCPLLRP